ncbi:hypothetical protein K504DRAFT_537030 [Pleomassaria siparia CBS 279.74]|uniref:Uncharacterized protein n=1 Tax=Pleomassaria siparia CBS 279.74 TaxID=1314801 RepID=A0A6G1JXU4_9PLEO|nr:hypothetical protein K504DRAFT_537030 [Pleomassaria siparia CBS 279.74]
MLDSSHFIPGTILWLPKQKDIVNFDGLDPDNTVPDKCFGHSVLVLAEEKHTNCIIILILTSFGGGKKIRHRVRSRGHMLQDYVPIHPARHLVQGTPSLQLSTSQEFVRQIWANVVEPRKCPKAWLQVTWFEIWKWHERSRRIEPSSLHLLALYAMQKQYDLAVYREILERHTARTISPCPQSNPVCVNIPDDAYTPATVVMPPEAPHDSFSIPRSEPNAGPRRMRPELEPLLPQTNRRSHLITHSYPEAAASGACSGGRGPSAMDFLGRLLKVLLALGVLIGVPWVGYVAVTWLVTACKNAIASIASVAWGKIATIALDVWRALGGIGLQLRALCEKLVMWAKVMLHQ